MSRIARLGLAIFSALIMLFAGIFLIGDKQFLFSTTYTLKSEFDSVAGLVNGAEVRVGGLRKGTVEDIRLPRQLGEKMVVAMRLDRSTRDFIKKDSTAAIETEGLVGNKFVSISFGSNGAPAVKNGDTISSQPPVDLTDLIRKTNNIMDSTNVALKNVDAATGDLKSITSKINRGEGTIGALINDRRVYEQVAATTQDVQKTVEEAKVGMTAFQENMQALKRNWFFRGFFNNRGYTDSAELVKHEIPKIPEGTMLRKFIFNAKDIFSKPDTAKLKKEKSLNQVGQFLEQNPFGLAVVTAYAGLAGDQEDNLVLTQARAMVVREFLVENFKIDDTKVKTKGMGEDAETKMGKPSRVEIIVYREELDKLLGKSDKNIHKTTSAAKPPAEK